MSKTICFYFQIHQPVRLKRYRFFDIGADHYYYDDYNNQSIFENIVQKSILPANEAILNMIKESKGNFKVAFSISGVALDQMEMYSPEVMDSFKELAKTGCVEFLAETYAHSLSSIEDEEEFVRQIKMHSKRIYSLFQKKPKTFRNTELIYSDDIGSIVSSLGYKTIITEGAKHILGWKSPNYIYECASNPKVRLLLKNDKLSDDISFRFSNKNWNEFPLTADKFLNWIQSIPENEKIINIFINYDTFGNLQPKESGIFEFLKAIPRLAEQFDVNFNTPAEITEKNKPAEVLSVPYNISWADEEKDTSAWLGNELQKEAVNKLYSIGERVRMVKDRQILQDWLYLQTSDHFYYMSTKKSSDGMIHQFFSPYDSPFSAFTNYMNVLSDFMLRVEAQYPSSVENEELNSLLKTINNQEITIEKLEKELNEIKDNKIKNSKIKLPSQL